MQIWVNLPLLWTSSTGLIAAGQICYTDHQSLTNHRLLEYFWPVENKFGSCFLITSPFPVKRTWTFKNEIIDFTFNKKKLVGCKKLPMPCFVVRKYCSSNHSRLEQEWNGEWLGFLQRNWNNLQRKMLHHGCQRKILQILNNQSVPNFKDMLLNQSSFLIKIFVFGKYLVNILKIYSQTWL